MPRVYKELDAIQRRLEKHYKDMQDIEFTIEKGRCGCCSAAWASAMVRAAVRMAVDMIKEKLIKKEEAVTRVTPAQLDELLHPIIDPKVEGTQKCWPGVLPAVPAAPPASVVFTAAEAVNWNKSGKR